MSDLSRTIEELGPWFHNLHLPGDIQTAPGHPLGDFPAFKWKQVASELPGDLDGWRVLDIGCNAGFYSFELAKRHALVLGIDVDEKYLRQARWAAGELGLEDRTEFRRATIYEMARESELFDIVLFMGVFYHLRYPLLGLDIAARLTQGRMIFQSLTIPDVSLRVPVEDRAENLAGLDRRDELAAPGWPRMAFVEDRFAGDPTNWWVPNRSGVEAMLRSTGMRIVGMPGDEIYVCAPDNTAVSDFARKDFESATGISWPFDS